LTEVTSKEGRGSVGWSSWAWRGVMRARRMTSFFRVAGVEIVVIYIA
jgi:hypothetical protein